MKSTKTQLTSLNITESDNTPIEELTDISSSLIYLQKNETKRLLLLLLTIY